MTIHHLFVYGTLLSGHAAPEVARLVGQMEWVGPATTKGRLYDLGKYPGAILDPSAKSLVYGGIYQLPLEKDLLKELDLYEEYDPATPQDSLFVRSQCFAETVDGRTLECWVYTYSGDVTAMPLIAGGNYAEFKARANH